VPAGAQHREQQQRADQRGNDATGQQHQEMRNRGVGVEHRRGVGPDTEERRTGKVQHAGVAELDVQSKRRHGGKHHSDDQKEDEVVFMEIEAERERRDHRKSAERILVPGERARGPVEHTEPVSREHSSDAGREHREHKGLLLDRKQRDDITGAQREGYQARQ
jgi:hypothetical protein